MEPTLYPHQQQAISKMHNGCILCGGVGTGKSITSLGYYYYKVSNSKPEKPLYRIILKNTLMLQMHFLFLMNTKR